ncbi:MAG: peptide chain release factor N(5)-glutamine methyltransferase [Candidatus Omnitrophica bacterium]|nr:peptide chain release factor N(5)-glutamine methyltransferase [Candidatus Omnitrophota bacterium]
MNEAELLFTELLDCDRLTLYQNRDKALDRDLARFVALVLKRRSEGEALQYILGKAHFMGREFKVDSRVLIPRPETELLVEAALGYITKAQIGKDKSLEVLELGTGSGCIAVTLALSLENISLTATDISDDALSVARENAFINKVSSKINFIQSDLFYLCNRVYDVIISNPPYVKSLTIDSLQPEVRYEPRIALDAGRDGLLFFRRIIQESSHCMAKDGLLILEIGIDQLEPIRNLFETARDFEIIHVVTDYNQIERIIVAKRIGKNG